MNIFDNFFARKFNIQILTNLNNIHENFWKGVMMGPQHLQVRHICNYFSDSHSLVRQNTDICVHTYVKLWIPAPDVSFVFFFSRRLRGLPLSIAYSALLSWSSCWQSWRKRSLFYEIHIPLSFTRKIKPEYEDIDDDGGNDWQHNCQPELYVGVHLDITITLNNPG